MAFLRVRDPQGGEPRDVALRKPLVLIGRAPGNDVVLDDPSLAPTHANLLRKGNHFTLSVIDRATTFTFQGMRARSTDLKVGDEVGFGRFFVTLMEGEPRSESRGPGPAPMNEVASLKRLVEFSRRLMSETSLEKVFALLLESVVEMSRAEKGFLIVLRDGERHLAASHNVGKETLDISRVSDSIVDKVIREQKAVIVSDAMHDAEFASARSVMELRLSSVMCVPLVYRNESLGALYLGNDSVRSLFQPADLAVLEIWAGQASVLLNTALRLDELVLTNKNLREQLRQTGQGAMIGQSPAMKAVFTVLKKVGPKDISVLVTGETGTGKELVARELHRLSPRASGPFVSLNCGAIPEHLLESELFGYKKGAFTGANTDKIGKFEAADGGTIFLDEIGEMPMQLQVKLLRVLQQRTIERVGDVKSRPLDIRVVSATNKNLAGEIAAGNFREDLYYRLAEVTVELPALRERGDDILQIAQFLLTKYAEQYGSRARGFSAGAMNLLKSYHWPGNVRELENRIKKAVIMTDRQQLGPDDLGLNLQGAASPVKALAEAEEEFKMEYIKRALDQNGWNKAQTARVLDVDPRTIFRYIEKFESPE
ncbi:MAG: sigma 54-interacting transcriptional regulator [Deltaproteobacteria bacterium]|nr:sigma 54-interacting transcriptional regulator [Deltaproteobacteria bacterium]